MANASVPQGLQMGQSTEDDEIEFTAKNFDQLPNGQSVSNTFSYKGDSWQLEARKCECQKEIVDVIVRLELVNKASENGITAQITCTSDPDQTSYEEDFDDIDDHMVGIFTFEGVLPSKDLKFEVQLNYDDDCADKKASKPSFFATEVLEWFQSEQFGDVTLVAKDGKKFKCHRYVLARRSPVFHQMFNEGLNEAPVTYMPAKVVNIDDFNGDVVTQLLLFIYTNESQIDKIADRLYAAAHTYQLELLKSRCETALTDNLSANTVFNTYRLANFYHLDDLKAACVDYLDTHKSAMSMADLLVEAFKLEGKGEGQQNQE